MSLVFTPVGSADDKKKYANGTLEYIKIEYEERWLLFVIFVLQETHICLLLELFKLNKIFV